MKAELIASIDIGTNTLRLLVAEIADDGAIKPLIINRYITRLGGGFTEADGITEEAAKRAFEALLDIGELLKAKCPARVFAVATSALRRATNRDWFITEGQKLLGYDIRIIDGDTEARLSLLGVASVLERAESNDLLVMDIGGGSTEYILSSGGTIRSSISLQMGVVKLTEELLHSDPPEISELTALEEAIDGFHEQLKESFISAGLEIPSGDTVEFVGTAGTVTTLVAISLGIDEYDPDKINGATLSVEEVEEIFIRLAAMTIKERLEIAALEKGREDLIVAGVLIVLLTMRAFGFKQMVVSDAGLLEGIIIDGA